MKKINFAWRILLLSVMAVFFTACGKDGGHSNANGTVGAQATKTYTEQEVDNDFNTFETTIDDLYNVGIDVIFDGNAMIIGFEYYDIGNRPLQRTYLENASASAQTVLAKYSKSYFVQTASGTTYTAQLIPARISELQLVIRESARVISDLFSGAYKPNPGQISSKPKMPLSNRQLDDWQKRNNTASSLSTIKGKKKKNGDSKDGNDGGTDPTTGGLTSTAKFSGEVALADGGEGTDPTTGGSPRRRPNF